MGTREKLSELGGGKGRGKGRSGKDIAKLGREACREHMRKKGKKRKELAAK